MFIYIYLFIWHGEKGHKIFFHPTTLTLQSDMRVLVTTTNQTLKNAGKVMIPQIIVNLYKKLFKW